MKAQFATAKNMFSAYLNQDFDLIFGTADDAIRAFVEHSGVEEVSRAAVEIESILAMKLPEPDLAKLTLQNLGCCYQYSMEWPSGDAWLRHLLVLLGR
ncbi:MAG: hypothetical protein CL858_03825 [Cupriavidus sp.]|jgi:hypothetical protein|uniref:contact-dependent growth inhibition system immunity protein n=1 Tax=Cupriavidus pauculus TaxID=82633 RepID=UPI000C5C496A|nr:contact-dependent growth inhibition system immunity protein [Cupriavidus pauculus]KAB0602923.1 hypothetical protein F7R19_10280 [Cupriavidus pauculus]MBU64585.1 hypothetical protein [Cupriavidus sp.]UAL03167.1 hypothetical protein K8O84_21155 [Cupriavidus pauculus]